MIKLPEAVLNTPHRQIALNGITIIESCFYEHKLEDTALTTEHELIVVRSGKLIVTAKDEIIIVQAGEGILARRGTYFHFQKLPKVIGQAYESVLFFIKEEFVTEFIQQHELQLPAHAPVEHTAMKIPASPVLKGFVQSLLPYFDQKLMGKEALLRVKTFELLLHIINIHPDLFRYFFQLNVPAQQDLVKLMEAHFTKNLPIKEFALLSGRSVSTFKRDFKKVFSDTPAKWLKKKRLQFAQKLLTTTRQRPTDIYLQVGFEDYAHFSKAFKSEFGLSPAQFQKRSGSSLIGRAR